MISKITKFQVNRKRQAGFSLMEAVIAISLSLVVTSSMVVLMSNSLGTATRIIGMTKLSDDMRSTMQMLTRDVRRTSYNANAMFCYGNDDCNTDGSLTVPGDITINDAATCFTFLMDRDHNGDSTENNAGGFRWVQADSIGSIEMWVGDNSPDCAATNDANWAQVTNPDSMDITTFTVNNGQSYDLVIFDDGVKIISQRVRRLRFAIAGRLVMDNGISRRMEDVISVRNDLLL
jgi:type II secretory pathway component PulJ